MSDKLASPFARLDTDLLRSTRRPEAPEADKPEIGLSGNSEILKAGMSGNRVSGLQAASYARKPESLNSRKAASREARKPERKQPRVQESLKAGKPESGETGKYSTQLRASTIKQVKRYALDHDLKDYEVVQAALDAYFASNSGGE